MKIGAIGDDFTGSSDLGQALHSAGFNTIQFARTPPNNYLVGPEIDAAVISLKTRNLPVKEAVAQSIEATRWLLQQGCQQIYFKYCSTFDSTPSGNIGPVIDALINMLDITQPVPVCPAFPKNGRTVYQGHLFVTDKLLSESGMENHPLTPMTDPDIRRWLARQSKNTVGHLSLSDLLVDPTARLAAESLAGKQLIVCDAVDDSHLKLLAREFGRSRLITGGSGLAAALTADKMNNKKPVWAGRNGPFIAFAGSCSKATLAQIAEHKDRSFAARAIDVSDILAGKETVEQVVHWAKNNHLSLPLIYSSKPPEEIVAIQSEYGSEKAAITIETFFGQTATHAVACGFERIVVAGGETSGAVVNHLNLLELKIGPKICTGVPALSVPDQEIAIALKSGNFGDRDFFAHAADVLENK
jgi:3-dehydrotetronate 4-kinase